MSKRTFVYALGLKCAVIVVIIGFLAHPLVAQISQPAQNPTVTVRPIPLPHLYWHFLILQDALNVKAAEEQAQGRDGSSLRNSLQKALGWSDTDYAPIQESATRLATELRALDDQAQAIRSQNPSNAMDQLKALASQREADISAEITSLHQAIPSERIQAFETFLTRFFSPSNAVPQRASTPSQGAPVVQK